LTNSADSPLRNYFGQVFTVSPNFLIVVPQIVGRIERGSGPIHTPIKNMTIKIHAPGQETKPIVEAVIIRPTTVSESKVPFTTHDGSIIRLAQQTR
jgi:hypothetical protein